MTTQTEIATGNERIFVWDHLNRLIAVIDEDSADTVLQEVEYVYDVMNRRIAKSVDGATTHFVYDRDNVLLEFEEGIADPSMRYLHGPQVDQVLAQEDALGTSEWLLGDHLGTIKDVVDDSGNLLNHLIFDSYGNLVGETDGSVDSRYAFTGREFDEETGLYYYRARYYNGELGRFISEDPVGFESETENLYGYVENSPTNKIDPLGLFGRVVQQGRFIQYRDDGRNGERFALNDTQSVINAIRNNPDVSIRSDITLAEIEWSIAPTGTPTAGRSAQSLFPGARGRDQKGHIVGAQLGGSGTDIDNLFPQDSRVNNGDWKAYENDVTYLLDLFNSPVIREGRCFDFPGTDLRYEVELKYRDPFQFGFIRRSEGNFRPYAVYSEAIFYNSSGLILRLPPASVTN
jgi:RHS repeat-associated protein